MRERTKNQKYGLGTAASAHKRKQRGFDYKSLVRLYHTYTEELLQRFYQASMLRVITVTGLISSAIAIVNSPSFSLENLFSFQLLVGVPFENTEPTAIITAVVLYLKDTPNRKIRQRNDLAKLIDSSTPQIHGSFDSVIKQYITEGISLDFFDFSNIQNLARVDLSRARIRGANFAGVYLDHANFQSTDLLKSNFEDVVLKSANLSKAILSGSNLHNAQLTAANLIEAKLCEANFFKANCDRANLTGSDLEDADLTEASFRHAKLNGANLVHANLAEAVLTGADLSNANLSQANLSDVNLSKAHFYRTTMPNGELWNSPVREYWNTPQTAKES